MVYYYAPFDRNGRIAYSLLNYWCGSSGDCQDGDLFANRRMAEFKLAYYRTRELNRREENRLWGIKLDRQIEDEDKKERQLWNTQED